MVMQPGQYTAYPYVPAQTNNNTMTDMLNAIMPIIMLVMLMAMVMPMMKSVAAGA
jgi:nitric oxide reductase large subunit